MYPVKKIKRLLCWLLLLLVMAIAIDLRGLQNLRNDNVSCIVPGPNMPAEEEVEKHKDCIDLYYHSHVRDFYSSIIFNSWLHADQHFESLQPPGPVSPPPELI